MAAQELHGTQPGDLLYFRTGSHAAREGAAIVIELLVDGDHLFAFRVLHLDPTDKQPILSWMDVKYFSKTPEP